MGTKKPPEGGFLDGCDVRTSAAAIPKVAETVPKAAVMLLSRWILLLPTDVTALV
jgi:hypothetical protein